MLPSLGFQEIVLLGIIALVVVGPKDLPLLLRKLGQWTAKLRGMAQEFRTGFDELARQAELDELRKEVDALRRTTDLRSIGNEFAKPLGTLESYAASPPPPPAPAPPLESPSMGDAAHSGAVGEPVLHEEPQQASPSTAQQTPPQSSLRDDSSPIEGEREPAPIMRSTQ